MRRERRRWHPQFALDTIICALWCPELRIKGVRGTTDRRLRPRPQPGVDRCTDLCILWYSNTRRLPFRVCCHLNLCFVVCRPPTITFHCALSVQSMQERSQRSRGLSVADQATTWGPRSERQAQAMVAGLAVLARSSRADVPCSRQAHCVLAGLGRGRSCYSEDRGPCVCDNWVFNIGPLGGPRYGWPRQGHHVPTPRVCFARRCAVITLDSEPCQQRPVFSPVPG